MMSADECQQKTTDHTENDASPKRERTPVMMQSFGAERRSMRARNFRIACTREYGARARAQPYGDDDPSESGAFKGEHDQRTKGYRAPHRDESQRRSIREPRPIAHAHQPRGSGNRRILRDHFSSFCLLAPAKPKFRRKTEDESQSKRGRGVDERGEPESGPRRRRNSAHAMSPPRTLSKYRRTPARALELPRGPDFVRGEGLASKSQRAR